MNATRDKALVAVRDPDRAEYSPVMQALTPRERLFVIAMAQNYSLAECSRRAGYGDAESDAAYHASCGWRESHRDKIIAALVEITKLQVRAMAPDAIQALKEIVNTKGEPARLRAVSLILSRVDPEITKTDINVKVEVVDHTAEAVQQLRILRDLGTTHEKLEDFFGHSGLQHYERLLAEDDAKRAITIEYSEIKSDPELDAMLGNSDE